MKTPGQQGESAAGGMPENMPAIIKEAFSVLLKLPTVQDTVIAAVWLAGTTGATFGAELEGMQQELGSQFKRAKHAIEKKRVGNTP